MKKDELHKLSNGELVRMVTKLRADNEILQERAHFTTNNGDAATADHLRRTSLLTQLAIEFRETLEPATIVERALMLLVSTLGLASTSIVLIGPDGAIELALGAGETGVMPLADDLVRSLIEHGLAGWVLRHGSSVVLSDISRDRRWLQFSEQHSQGSVIVLPIRQSQETLGVLTVHKTVPNAFVSYDLLLMEGVAAQLGVALHAAQQYRSERHRRDQALALFAMSQYLNAERSFEEMAAMLQEKSVSIFGVDYGLLYLHGGEHVLMPIGVPDHLAGARDPALLKRVADIAREAFIKRSSITDDTTGDETRLSCVALPLVHGGNAIGAFVLVRAALQKVAFSANTWSLLTIFMHVVAAACANVQLVDQLRRHAIDLETVVEDRTHQLQQSRDILRYAFDALPHGVLLLDTEEVVLAANVVFCQAILGREPSTVVGQSYTTLWQELEERGQLHIQTWRSQHSEAQTPGSGNQSLQVCCKTVDGSQRWFVIERTPLSVGSGPKQMFESWREETTIV